MFEQDFVGRISRAALDAAWQEAQKMFGEMFAQFGQGLGAAPQGLDPYAILGLERTASDDEVKSRYREFARRLHPDTAGMKGTEFLFRLVTMAYETIRRERGWR